jgi:hypothetical protein
MSNSKITLDDVLRYVKATTGADAVAHVTINRVKIDARPGYLVDTQRTDASDPALAAARYLLEFHAPGYIAGFENSLREAEEAVVRARSALDEANAIVAKLTAAVEAAK